jgi:predicted dehydrogenase
MYAPELGGGALMDVGVYPVSLAQMFFGAPDKVAALGTLGDTGVDENTGMLMHFSGGQMAVLHTAIQVNTAQKATLLGTDGRLEIVSPWWKPQVVLVHKGGQTERFDFSEGGEGFQFEAAHVAECLRAGKTESDIVPHADTLAVMGALDEMRAQLGIKYPME